MTVNYAKIGAAMHQAISVHGEQKYSDRPYAVHLLEVYEICKDADRNDHGLLCAAWLHDAVEDTDLCIGDVQTLHGSRVAELVNAVTDGDGENRRARKERPYSLIPTVRGALTLKLADRLANIRSCVRSGNVGLLRMYSRESRVFHERLIHPVYHSMLQHDRCLWFMTLKALEEGVSNE